MIKYLLAAKDKPTAITKERKDVKKAFVTPNFSEGEIFLKNEAGKFFRLHWTKKDKARKRYIAPGSYRMTGFRIVEGKWFISSTTGKKTLTLVSDKETKLEIDSSITVQLKTKRDQNLRLQMSVTGFGGAGLSIYFKGKRIPIPFVIEGQRGKVLASGTMKYG